MRARFRRGSYRAFFSQNFENLFPSISFIKQDGNSAEMVKRIGTGQRKTRHKFRKGYREKGKISLSRYFQELKPGDKVCLKIDSAQQKGRFHSRFHGKSGTVTGKQGFCYLVSVRDGHKEKTLYVHPLHLIKHQRENFIK